MGVVGFIAANKNGVCTRRAAAGRCQKPPAGAAEPDLLLQVHVGIGRRPSGRWTAQNCCPVKLVWLPDSPKLDFVSLEPAAVDLSSGGIPDFCAAVFTRRLSKIAAPD